MKLDPARRRLYLMRHGSVDYFREDGSAVPPDDVPLNADGIAQAQAAGALMRECGVKPDRILTSGLPRTLQTAEHVKTQAGLDAGIEIEIDEALQEIRPGRLADIPRENLVEAFLGAFRGGPGVEAHRFLNGETVGEMLDRVLPAFDRWLARSDWQCGLMVLHGGVNRALLSTAMSGSRAFFGAIEQSPACINVLDVAADHVVLRAVNIAPTQWLHQRERYTTMEKLLAQYTRAGAPASP